MTIKNRLLFLTLLTILLITSTAALSWESPENGELDYLGPSGENIELIVDGPNLADSESLEIYYNVELDGWTNLDTTDEGEGNRSASFDNTAETTNGDNVQFRANTSSSEEVDNSEINFEATSDISGPSLTLEEPSRATKDEDTLIEVSSSDDVSDVENITMTVFNSNDDEIDSTTCSSSTCELDNLALEDGDYSVEASSYDVVGNEGSDDWSFTVDTSYEGPTSFDFSPSPGVIDVDEDDREVEVTIEGTGDEQTEKEMLCFVNGNEEDSVSLDLSSLQDGDDITEACEIPDDYDSEFFDFEVEIVDEAGNFEVSNSEEYGFDALPPSVSHIETVDGVSAFNQDFEIEYASSDDVSEVRTVEYYIGDDPGLGEGTQFSEASGEITINTEDLDSGGHTVYLRAEDDFGKWGGTESFDFEFYPNEVPELEMTMEDSLEVTLGETETLDVGLSNTGELLVSEGEVQASEMADSVSYGDLMPGEDENLELVFSPEDEFGEYSVMVEASTVDVSQTVSVTVTADESTRNDIENEFENFRNSHSDLSEKVEATRPGLSEERKERLDSDFSSFDSSFQDLENAIESEEYYRADEILEGIDVRQQSAQETFEAVEEEQRVADRNRLIILFSMLLLGGLGTGAVYVAYNDEYEVSIPSVEEMPDFDEVKSSLQESLGSDSESTESEDDGGYTSVADSEADKESSESLADKISSKINELTDSGEDSDEPKVEFK